MIIRLLLLMCVMSSSCIIGSENKPVQAHSNSLGVSSVALVTEFDILRTKKQVKASKGSWSLKKLLAGALIALATFSTGMLYERTTAKPIIQIIRENETVVVYAVPYDRLDVCREPAMRYIEQLRKREMWKEYYEVLNKYCLPHCDLVARK